MSLPREKAFPARGSAAGLPRALLARVAGLGWGEALGLLCVPALWVFAQPYGGITGDARIYMARALADLDPGGVGRDLMFTQDGQAAFSLFRLLADALVAAFGPKQAALALAIVNLVVWFAAMAALAGQFVRGSVARASTFGPASRRRDFCLASRRRDFWHASRRRDFWFASRRRVWAVLMVFAAVLPCPYGFYPLMTAREIVAVPRPLSEAAILLALAALCAGRTRAALGLTLLAAVLHPIMALSGAGLVVLTLGWRDRRWFAAAGVALVGTILAALVGVPVFARLVTEIDAPWRALLEDRTPYLFVGLWPAASLAPIAVQAATLIAAGLLCEGRQRTILLGAVAVGCAGVAAAWLFGDRLSLLLVVQVQPWRALWLVGVLAMPALGLCALHLPTRGALGQIALAFFGLAWITFATPPIAPVAAGLGLALAIASRTQRPVLSPFVVPAVCGTVIALGLWLQLPALRFAFDHVATLPQDPLAPFRRLGLLPLPVILLVLAAARWPARRLEPVAAGLVLASLVGLVAVTWDTRTASAKRIESGVHDATLAARLAGRPGAVLWLTSDDTWYWLGRPQWNSFTQGSGIVFSRPLAMQWRDRTNRLIAQGLIDAAQRRPWQTPSTILVPQLTASAITGLCTPPDAPAWIVAPLPAERTLPAGVDGFVWHAPGSQAIDGTVDGHPQSYVFDAFAVVPCAGSAKPP